ncbi:MAG TPA: GHKL domain-containing protein, partial [Clostridia bacterium]|nr:GHKL domain-containing protein [Clostridia bacterium]
LLISQINKHIAERQRQYYEYQMQMMKSTYDNTRMLRHDLKNKLSPLHNLALAGNSEELAVQLAKLMDICYENKEYSKSGNSTIDSIINFKLQHAEAKGITVTTDIIIPAELSISTFDIAVVIGNLVDNALEATIKTTDRWIDIKIKYTNSVYLKVGLSVFYDGKNLLDHTERGYPPRCSVSRYKNESNKGIGFGKRLWHFILWGRGIMVISRSRNKEGCVVKKAILSGLGASIIFYIVCGILSGTLADIIFFTGDPFIMSFHQYTYMGLVILCGIIVTCTVFLNTKLDNLKNELLNNENRK